MSVTNETYRVQITLATVVQAIPIPFYFLEQDDLIVFQTVAGADTLMVLNTNYTLAGEGVEAGGTLTTIGGTVGAVWTIARADALTQSEEFLYSGALSPTSVERGYDRLAMQIQRIYSMAARSLRLPVTNAEGGELALNDRKGQMLGFNATTGAPEYTLKQDIIDDAAAAALASEVAAQAAQAAAELAETNAELAKTNAELAEINAETAEANAEQAVIDAGVHVTLAAAQVALATTQANNASGSASAAGLSAANAAASAATALAAQAVQFKGGIAGASVPATSTAAGDYYKITSAGTSQSKTWVVGDQAIYNGSSGNWTQITGYFAASDAADLSATAALIEREGLRFDGTAGAVIGGGGIPAVGTGDFTFVAQVKPDNFSAARYITGATAGPTCAIHIDTDARVKISDLSTGVNAATSTLSAGISSFISIRRVSGQVYFGINGAEDAPVATSHNYSVSSAFYGASSSATNNPLLAGLAHGAFFNYALTAAEIAALQRRGLVTLPEQRGGSITPLLSNTFNNEVVGWTTYTTGTITPSVGFATIDNCPIWDRLLYRPFSGFSPKIGQKFKIVFEARASVARDVLAGFYNTATISQTIPGDSTWRTYTFINTWEAISLSAGNVTGFICSGGFDVRNWNIIPLGTLFEQDTGQRNAGYMVRDTSGNGRHIELPETGVSIIDPADTGFIEYTRATDGFLIGDRRVIPSTGYLFEVVATGNGTVTLGESAGTPANVCASVTLTSTPKILPILVTQTSTGKLYVDLGTATTATFKIRLRAV